jgi:two-component system, chemotaxis family, CheB/CheR fusion protein
MDELHNLRGHLNTIQTSTDFLVDLAVSAGYPSQEIEQARVDIQRAINAQARFLSELQLVALLRQQKLVLRSMPFDLPVLVARLAQQLDADYQTYQCGLTISIEDEIPFAWGDALRIEQILYRVLINALQSTHKNAGSVGAVCVRMTSDGNTIKCLIEDNGCGIAPDDLVQIVARLERAVGDGQFESTTLELSACAQLLRLNGGSLAITSPGLGYGSTIGIQLPSIATSHLHKR